MLSIIEAFVTLLLQLVVELFFNVVICGFFSFLGEVFSAMIEKTRGAIEATSEAVGDATEAAAASLKNTVIIICILVATGICAGIGMSITFPDRIFKAIPLTGISLLITPLAMGLVMSMVGTWKVNHDRKPSFMATFIGGALFGLAAAGTRLIYLTKFEA